MKDILKLHLEMWLKRYDKVPHMLYLNRDSFDDLFNKEDVFVNKLGQKLHYYIFQSTKFPKDEVILFLCGIGPGHCSYMREINQLCQRGYKVLTFDYMGCGDSEGERFPSAFQPTSDAMELLDYLQINREIIVVGHSFGGFTALNILNLRKEIKKGIILSGFYSASQFLKDGYKKDEYVSEIMEYEKTKHPEYIHLDNIRYLKETDNKILFIHSLDDPTIKFSTNTGYIMDNIDNSNLSFVVVNGKKHTPHFLLKAVEYDQKIFDGFNKAKSEDQLIKLMKNKNVMKMTEPDEMIWDKVFEFLK